MATAIVVPPNLELETQAMTLPERAASVQVFDQATHDQAALDLLAIARLEREIIAYHKPFKQQADKLHKDIVAAEAKLLAPLKAARPIYSNNIMAWEGEQRRIQQEAQRRANAEARRVADEAALAAAAQAEEAGAPEEVVQEILAAPPVVVAPVVAPTFQKAAGIAATERWHGEVISIKTICQAVLDGKIPETAIEVNMPWLNARARSDKEQFNVPGAKAVKEIGTRVSTR